MDNKEDIEAFEKTVERLDSYCIDGNKRQAVKIIVKATGKQFKASSGKAVWPSSGPAILSLRNSLKVYPQKIWDSSSSHYKLLGYQHPTSNRLLTYSEWKDLQEQIFQKILKEVVEIVPIT